MEVTKHRFTVEEYRKMGEAGIFHEDDRVELIAGEVVEMSPIGDEHVECVIRLTQLLNRWIVLESAGTGLVGAALSVQNPVRLGEEWEPQPDLVLLKDRGSKRGVPDAGDVALVVEVADTSLAYDREIKLPSYSQAGIPEVWIVDLRGPRVELYAGPTLKGYRYAREVGPGQRLRSATVEGLSLALTEIFS